MHYLADSARINRKKTGRKSKYLRYFHSKPTLVYKPEKGQIVTNETEQDKTVKSILLGYRRRI